MARLRGYPDIEFELGCSERGRRSDGEGVSLRGHFALDDENSHVAAAEAGLGIARAAGATGFPEPAPPKIV
jgi:hypothetical protein